MLTALVALNSTLATTRLQSNQGMNTKQLVLSRYGLFEFLVLLFVLINAPSIF